MKNLRLVAASVVVLVVVMIALTTYDSNKSPVQAKCGIYRNDTTVTVGAAKIRAEVAQTPQVREKGLSGRPCIEANQGMLFTFDQPAQWRFWMKDMKFPIDIVWIDSNRKVIGFNRDVSPSTYPDYFTSEKPAQYVLELQANRTKELNVNLGTQVDLGL